MIFHFKTKDDTPAPTPQQSSTARRKTKRLAHQMNHALRDGVAVSNPRLLGATLTTLTAVTVYPY